MNSDCIFCRIVSGELPCTRIYEDDHVLAFLDIGPIIKGHTLVIPKRHYDPITETPPEVLANLIGVVRAIAIAQVEGLSADGINVTQANGRVAGQVVPHIHFHVIPRFKGDGHSWNWNARSYESPEDMQHVADRITGALAN
jgi:histidine triad (HIT) family protein